MHVIVILVCRKLMTAGIVCGGYDHGSKLHKEASGGRFSEEKRLWFGYVQKEFSVNQLRKISF